MHEGVFYLWTTRMSLGLGRNGSLYTLEIRDLHSCLKEADVCKIPQLEQSEHFVFPIPSK